MIIFQLFLSFLQVSLLDFGGGYAAIPLIQEQVVNFHNWLTMKEFTDLITISEMTPGPIAINSATFVGTRIAGFPGAIAATLGCVLPAFVVVSIIAKLYLKYRSMFMLQSVLNSIRPAVVAMIASAGASILISALWGSKEAVCLTDTRWVLATIFAVCLILLRKFKLSPILVILSAGFIMLGLSLAGI